LCVSSAQTLHRLPEELKSHFYYQDAASQWCCYALGAQPNERIADVCAAPGGKSMTVAQYMQNCGVLDAADLYEQKCAVIQRRAADYGLSCIRAMCRDASTEPEHDRIGQYDRVICDAPCSGMGVVRRKPEIRYKDPADFKDLPALQLEILSQAAKLVRAGGVLQYSTCTLRPEENEQVAEAFLAQHPEFSPRALALDACFEKAGLPISHQITLFPHIHGTDGFYVAAFVKSR
jgi:16S rRNA (cytosine967-C5)-methyltransferase